MSHPKSPSPIRVPAPGLLVAALTLAALSLTGCFDSSTSPKTSSPCADDASLCIPRGMLLDTGEAIFQTCAGCHGSEGRGERGPTVANSNYVMDNLERLIRTVLNGLTSEDTIYVNGQRIIGNSMPSWRVEKPEEFGGPGLSDFQIASVLTYIRAVLNDSLVSNCVQDPVEDWNYNCDRTPRSAADIANDSVAVWEVKAVRDTLPLPSWE